ncbi:2'-5' RNA ligase family protein [Lunatibacter salilacus]|uniref:2'-5' RNA ligase family protein n=1 Tax=Lunatibacter salilacus TaxID=2483804 RepID=UPI00131BC83D|nr:2'-5' RNA ligase family protein [Lunatibacter salilacus]
MQQHYDTLHDQALEKIQNSGFEFDRLIDDESDTRRGLTLLFRPEEHVLENVREFLRKVSGLEPYHYFYRNSDVHITVMPIISCYDGFTLDKVDPQAYIQLIGRCVEGISPFEVSFKGVIFSPSCIIIKGYPLDDSLDQLRENLRGEFPKVSLEQSLDKRYLLRTAHSTIVRFKKPLLHPEKMVEFVSANGELNFGVSTVRKLSFVYNDWYQREEKVTVLSDYLLQ